MRQSIILGVLLISFSYNSAKAQESKEITRYNTIYVSTDINSAYNKVIDYIQDSDYFILALDKSSGFIQAKTAGSIIMNPGTKREYSTIGMRITLNFIIRAINDNQSRITLSIYEESRTFYYEAPPTYVDIGVSQDELQYREILDDLIKAFM